MSHLDFAVMVPTLSYFIMSLQDANLKIPLSLMQVCYILLHAQVFDYALSATISRAMQSLPTGS